MVNIPLMRQIELLEGMTVSDAETGEVACRSRACAVSGITQVVTSRVVMAAPGMFCLPFIMKAMEKKAWFRSRPALHGPFQVAGVGCFLLFMVPFACALFPRMSRSRQSTCDKKTRRRIHSCKLSTKTK